MDHLDYSTEAPARKRGQHLTFQDRCTISILHDQGKSYREIAAVVNCSPSTICYELRRGTAPKTSKYGRSPKYLPNRGETEYRKNRRNSVKPYKFSPDSAFGQWVIPKILIEKWSPDACVGYAKLHHLFPEEEIVCTKTLYNAVWGKRLVIQPMDLPEAIKRNHEPARKHKRLMGTSIDERPEKFGQKTEFGHWEIDTVVGRRAGKESVLLTLVEKKTRYYQVLKIAGKNSQSVLQGLEALRDEYGEHFSDVFKSLTADNGTEFEQLSTIEEWGTKVYFAHPYSSWERPQNERHNRMLRRYVPKGRSIEDYTSDEISGFADDINGRPRKILNYQSAEEVYEEELDRIYADNTAA